MRAVLVLTILAACRAAGPPPATTGALAGEVRDQDTGASIASAEIALQRDGELRPTLARSSADGGYAFPRVRPGRYSLTASYAGVTVDVRGVDVAAGRAIDVDLDLALGRPEVRHLDFGDPHQGELRRYRPAGADPRLGRIEGTVTDVSTRERIAGAVVTASSPALREAVQVVSDDHGRYAMPGLPPGDYSVSAYYTVASHGTIEVERNQIPVHGGEAAVVPLFVETQQ